MPRWNEFGKIHNTHYHPSTGTQTNTKIQEDGKTQALREDNESVSQCLTNHTDNEWCLTPVLVSCSWNQSGTYTQPDEIEGSDESNEMFVCTGEIKLVGVDPIFVCFRVVVVDSPHCLW